MHIISDIIANKAILERAFTKHGSAAEHHYYCYRDSVESCDDPYVFVFDDDMAVFSKYDREAKEWYLFTEIVAPLEKRYALLLEVLEFIFTQSGKHVKKVWCEFEDALRKRVTSEFKNHARYVARKDAYALTWPVFDLSTWTGDKMEGKEWKDMRYYWHKYHREHKVEFKDCRDCDKTEMKKLILDWKKQRTATDRVYPEHYLHAVDHDFEGYAFNRIMVVDGKVAAITAGIQVRPDYYYSTIGVYTYTIERTGEICNMDDLINLKKNNVRFVDFGGGEEALTEFKKKFKPYQFYTTHIFSIVQKEESHD